MVVVWTAENGSYWSRITWKVMVRGEESMSSKHWCLPGSSVHGILQTRVLEWVAIPFSRGSSWPRDRTWVSYTAGRFFTLWASREAPYSTGDAAQGIVVTQRERKPKKAGMCVYAHLVHSGGQQKLTQLCKALCCCRLVAKLCPALCSPMDCKLPGSSFLGISQVRILGWITISFSKNSNYTPTKINFKNALIHLTLKLSMNRTHRYRNQDETAQDSWETKRRAQKAESYSHPVRLSTPWHSCGPWYFLICLPGNLWALYWQWPHRLRAKASALRRRDRTSRQRQAM